MKSILLLIIGGILLLCYLIIPTVLITNWLERKYNIAYIFIWAVLGIWIILNCTILYFLL